jgi:hypothetical protein
MRTRATVLLATAAIIAIASIVSAQTPPAPFERAYVNVNVAFQPQSRDFDTATSFSIYDETANVIGRHHVGGGALFDISGGYKVWHDIRVGVGFSSFGDTSEASFVASIPHPDFPNEHATITTTLSDLEHTERAVYVQAVYFMPITNNFDLAFGIGPTFIHVSQDLITGASVPAGTQNATPILEKQSATATGINVSFDGTYLFTRRYGAGLFLRYSGASVDLPAVSNVNVGGFQIGIGGRVRF